MYNPGNPTQDHWGFESQKTFCESWDGPTAGSVSHRGMGWTVAEIHSSQMPTGFTAKIKKASRKRKYTHKHHLQMKDSRASKTTKDKLFCSTTFFFFYTHNHRTKENSRRWGSWTWFAYWTAPRKVKLTEPRLSSEKCHMEKGAGKFFSF